jgi:hypothetical protein
LARISDISQSLSNLEVKLVRINLPNAKCVFIHEWPDWSYEIHYEPEQIFRQSRAMERTFTCEINNSERTARFSSNSDLPYYETSLKQVPSTLLRKIDPVW